MKSAKFRINILDFVILLLVVGCIVGVALRLNLKSASDKNSMQKATVTFFVAGVKKEALHYLHPGDRLYSSELAYELGEFVSVTSAPAISYMGDDGEIKELRSVSGRLDLTGKFVCEGIYSPSSGFLINGVQYIAPGMQTIVTTPGMEFQIEILEVNLEP